MELAVRSDDLPIWQGKVSPHRDRQTRGQAAGNSLDPKFLSCNY